MKPKRNAVAVALASFVAAATPAFAQDETPIDDGDWIALGGQVDAILATSFMLDYGDNDITVELDQFNWDIAKSLLQGEQVIVIGRMDSTLYDERSVEAATVYVPRLQEFIYADPEDEEGDPSLTRGFAPGIFSVPEDGDWVSIAGSVTEQVGDVITVQTGVSLLNVDTSPDAVSILPRSVEVGDRVLVSGEMDAADLFELREVQASSITKLSDASK